MRSRKRKFSVRGAWGIPHQAVLEIFRSGKFSKTSKPVQVYIACQFVKAFILAKFNAKLLYGFLLNRTQLSQRSKWENEDGHIFVIYTIRQMAEDLDRSERTVQNALNELDASGLIQRVRQGRNKANRIFVMLPDMVQLSASPDSRFCVPDMQDSADSVVQDLPASNIKQENKEESEKEKGNRTHRRFGEYQNVFLTDDQFKGLQSDFPSQYESYIQRLSVYMETNGRQHANHEATIRKWITEDDRTVSGKHYEYEQGECL